jgi:glycosyltransferase involved in cell wall biosynthesis
MVALRHAALDDRIYYKEARSLAGAGYDIHVINRLRNGAFTDMGGNPVGYPDDGGAWVHDGIVFHGIARQQGTTGRWREYHDTVKLGLSLKADVYHCHESDIALFATAKIKKTLQSQTKFIFDAHEYWAGAWAHLLCKHCYYASFVFCSLLERHLLRNADHIIASDAPTAGALQVYDLNRKVTVIYNSPVIQLQEEKSAVRLPGVDSAKTVLCHEGRLDRTRKVDVVAEVIDALKEKCVLLVAGGIEAGGGALDLKVNKLKEQGTIIDLGWIPYEELYGALGAAQIGLILLENHPNYVTAAPNKLFNYMALGIPIVAEDYPGLRDVIERHRCGLLVNGSSHRNYVEAITYLIEHPEEARLMGVRGREAVSQSLSWPNQVSRLLDIYSEVLERSVFHQ